MPSRKRNIITGIVVLSAMGMLVWMILTFSGGAMRIFKKRGTPVVFVCERADGLSDGSPVFFKGVEIGKVTRVTRLADNEHVSIEGELENSPPLPRNLVGQIKAQSSLGSSSEIDLTTGDATTGVGEPAAGVLTANQEIKLRYVGQSLFPPEFSDMMTQANKQNLVKHVDDVFVSLLVQVEKVGKVMDSTQALIDDKGLRDTLGATMTNIRSVTLHADAIATKLEKLADKTDAAVDGVTVKLVADLDTLGIAFKHFQEISRKINDGKGTAAALINDPKLYEELALTAKQLNAVAASLARLVDQWEHEGVSVKLPK